MKNKTSQIIMLILVLTVGNYLFFSIKSNIKNYDFFMVLQWGHCLAFF